MNASTHLRQLRRAEIESADAPSVLLLLVNEAVRSAEAASLEDSGPAQRPLVDKSRRIVSELAATLNADYAPEMAFNLLRLYLFINRRLLDSMNGDPTALSDALRILRHVRDTWEQAVPMARREVVE